MTSPVVSFSTGPNKPCQTNLSNPCPTNRKKTIKDKGSTIDRVPLEPPNVISLARNVVSGTSLTILVTAGGIGYLCSIGRRMMPAERPYLSAIIVIVILEFFARVNAITRYASNRNKIFLANLFDC